MNMRNVLSPYGGCDPMIDKVIGPTAFDIVRFVALNMNNIQYLGANMEKVDTVYQQLMATYTVKGKTLGAGEVVTLTLPMENLPKNLISTEVFVRTSNDAVFTAASGYFRWSIIGNTLIFTMNAGVPSQLENADLCWVLTGS